MFFVIDRNDRSGSIIQLMYYCIMFCKVHNLKYDGIISAGSCWWYNRQFFNYIYQYFGVKNIILTSTQYDSLKKIPFNTAKIYKETDELVGVIFKVSDFHPYFSNNINNYFNRKILQSVVENIKKPNRMSGKKIISVHIRRGDVNSQIPRRYTTDDVYVNVIQNILKVNDIKDYEIHIYSERKFNGDLKLFSQFNNIKFHLEVGTGFNDYKNIFSDLIDMIDSDYLICSKSSFSYISALLNIRGKIYYNNKFWIKPLNSFYLYNDETGLLL